MKTPIHIIKIGGAILDDPARLPNFLAAFSALAGDRILVHGGGRMATDLAGKLGLPQQLIDGRRLTDAATLQVVTMVYAGWINKTVTAALNALGSPALGLSGADGFLLRTRRRTGTAIDYGFAGDVESVNLSLLQTLLRAQVVPVVSPITSDASGQLLNTNADTVAAALADALAAHREAHLVYCFEKSGVLLDAADDATRIARLDGERYAALRRSGAVSEGMIPKLDAAFRSLEQGCASVSIGPADDLPGILQQQNGTRIVR